jgi:hypothetical protein
MKYDIFDEDSNLVFLQNMKSESDLSSLLSSLSLNQVLSRLVKFLGLITSSFSGLFGNCFLSSYFLLQFESPCLEISSSNWSFDSLLRFPSLVVKSVLELLLSWALTSVLRFSWNKVRSKMRDLMSSSRRWSLSCVSEFGLFRRTREDDDDSMKKTRIQRWWLFVSRLLFVYLLKVYVYLTSEREYLDPLFLSKQDLNLRHNRS